jgi:site-specific DNA-cytosine methylase
MLMSSHIREVKHFHFCCGIGGAAKGFNKANPRVGSLEARFRCLGGVDVDPSAIRDFDRLVGVPGTVMDLFTREQYIAFHGKEPPADWREMGAADIRRAAGNERPNIVFISSPCKGGSGLLSEEKSKTPKYQALNELTLRCVWLMCEAWGDDPVDLIVFENVPRLATRGRHLLDQIIQLLQRYGYAVAETSHDCGELGALAQSRKRMLLVARHTEKVPAFLYEPEKKRLRAVGDVLGRMPFPGDTAGGPMHRIPRLQWKTWVRLAFVEAGSDWRSLNKLAVENGHLRDFLIVPELRNGVLGVNRWDEATGAVTSRAMPNNGNFSVADPRFDSGKYDCGQYGLCGWDETMGAVINVKSPGQGMFAVQDPRSTTGFEGAGKYLVTPFDKPAGTVIAGSTTGQGAFAVADPRSAMNNRVAGDAYLTGGHYGVVPWDGTSGAVSASAGYDNGRWSVADPRIDALPALTEKTVAIIRALDGTWHRPFTTLELAALQSLIEPEEHLLLDGMSDSVWREHIGNLVPPKAATAIGEVMGTTLLLAWSGETFVLSATPIWVRNVALALTMPGEQRS